MIDSAGIEKLPCPPRRRRWLIGLTLLCLLLIIVVVIVWATDRPLSDAERRLVGTWRNGDGTAVFTFHANRTVTAPGHPPGVWHMEGNRFFEADSRFEEAVRALLFPGEDPAWVFAFEDDDTISVSRPANDGKFQWQRIAESPSPAH